MSFKAEFRARINDIKKKKVENKFINKKNTHRYNCLVCNVSFNNDSLLQAHQSESSHLNKLKLFKEPEFKPKKRTAEVVVEEEDTSTKVANSTISSSPQLYIDTSNSETVTFAESSELPEGFFDNPEEDAKARKITYVNKFEDAYDAFRKEIKQDLKESDKFIDNLLEETGICKDEEEILCMQSCIERMKSLRERVDRSIENENTTDEIRIEIDTDENSDSDVAEDLFEWRYKPS